MKIFEIITDKKTKQEKIIINFPDPEDHKFLLSLSGSIYYHNTKIFSMKNCAANLHELRKKEYYQFATDYISSRYLQVIVENNYLNITCDKITQYCLMKDYTFFDYSDCYQFKMFDPKKIKRITLFKVENDIIKIPVGFKNEFMNNIIEDKRKIRKWKFTDNEIKTCLGYLELYQVQIEAVKSCFLNTTGIIELVGGLGKTEIFLALIKLMKLKTLIITKAIDLSQQTYSRGIKAGLNIGLVQGNNIEEKEITICTIQSSHKLKDKYEMVIVDECHNCSERYIPVLSSENIIYRFGFSATPFEKDKLKNAYIKSFIGDIIFKGDNKQLIKEKKIAEPIINIIEINKPEMPDIKDWWMIEKFGIIDNLARNLKIIEICKKKKGILILIKKIDHGKILEELLICEGIRTEFLRGETPKLLRQEVLQDFEKDNNFVLIGSDVLKEGISINAVHTLILAGGGQSYFSTLQSLYRGTRIKLKDQFNVFDFMDNFNYITLKHSKQRIKDFKQNGFDKINYI